VDLTHFVELAGELRQPFHEYHGILLCAAQALLFGRLADAERFARAAVKIGSRLPGLDASGAYGMQMFALARERGELQSLAPVVRQFMQATPQSAVWRPALALVLAEVGQIPEARDELAQLAANHFASVARDSFWLTCMVYLAEVCAAVCDAERAEQLYPMLAPWKGYNVVAASATVCLGPTDHYLGMLSTVMRRWQDAERHLEAAIAMNQRQGAVPWLAHSQYRYLCMLLERNHPCDLPRARTLWEATRRLAEDLGMVTLTQRLQSLQSALGDRRPAPLNPGGLSRREAQVLRMVANGKSNHEIAAAIFRSPNTVANHVRSILAKLGVANRTEAASVAARNGLL
jgi:DNA-binding CsgD family transcriptional regulator